MARKTEKPTVSLTPWSKFFKTFNTIYPQNPSQIQKHKGSRWLNLVKENKVVGG